MIPNGKSSLEHLAMKLMTSVAPQTTSTYTAANTGLIAMLLQCLAQEYDRAADARLSDIDEIKALLASLPPGVPRAVVARIESFRGARPASFRVADVTAHHAEALTLLALVHEHAEQAQLNELDEVIWRFLERMADRHAFNV